jgi:hypothetical protein
MTITNSNLFSEPYDVVESFLKNNITDPRGRHKSNWIHASMPHINSMSFEGYPFMILRINLFEDNQSFSREKSQKNFRAIITVYSNEPTDIEEICDQIADHFRDEAYLTDFPSRSLSASPINWTLDQKGKKVLFREINLEFKKRL